MTQSPPHVAQHKNSNGFVLFAAGHRPFFLFTVISAIIYMAIWLIAHAGRLELTSLWHAHEMIFGFAAAAIGGFLMAAVPNWTAHKSPSGIIVIFLFGFWLMGRISFTVAAFSEELEWLAWLDLIYLPLITAFVARMIIKANNKRNLIFVAILIGLFLTNFLYHLGFETESVRAALYMVLLLATLIGGRVVPLFTQNALRMKYNTEIPCKSPAWTHPALMALISLAAIVEYVDIGDVLSGLLAMITALVLIIRMKNWNSIKSLFDPIVWILHAAYIWLPIGFALKAISLWTDLITPTQALHGLSVGAIGLLIVAVASRAALGHSGRALKVSKVTTTAYVVLILATAIRVFLDSFFGIHLAGGLWILGFGLLAYVYGPILTRPRIDGMAG